MSSRHNKTITKRVQMDLNVNKDKLFVRPRGNIINGLQNDSFFMFRKDASRVDM
jgi:hypothetical protein